MYRKYLEKEVSIIIDRPLGSKHPKYDHIYPINYGYIPNTISGDGMEIDVYILGEDIPLETYTGKVIAVIERQNDVEDKLVVAKEGIVYSKTDIEKEVQFQEQYFKSTIIMKRDL